MEGTHDTIIPAESTRPAEPGSMIQPKASAPVENEALSAEPGGMIQPEPEIQPKANAPAESMASSAETGSMIQPEPEIRPEQNSASVSTEMSFAEPGGMDVTVVEPEIPPEPEAPAVVVDELELQAQDVTTDVVVSDGAQVAEKPQKKEDRRDIPQKKIPAMFKKSYSGWGLEHQILKKIYIPEDRELLERLFVPGANAKKPGRYAVPADTLFTKRELARLKTLSKEIKSHRGIVHVVPLVATVAALVLLAAVVIMFKDRLARQALVTVCEKVFGAITDVDDVHLEILGSSLTIRHIQVGNRNSVMKNLFEAQKIEVDFDLTQALRGKFDAQNLEASGLAFDTDRTYSCYIPHEEKDAGEAIMETPFMQSLVGRSTQALEELYTQVTDVLGGDDIDAIVANVQKQLQTPAMFTSTIDFGTGMITKWSAKPAELEAQVTSFARTIQDLQTLQVSKTFDAQVLQDNLTKINNAITASRAIKDTAVALVEEVKGDVTSVQTQAELFMDAAKADVQFATDKLTAMRDIGENSRNIFVNALDSVGYDVIGKYYPYAKQAISYAEEIKEKADEIPFLQKKEKEKKTTTRERMQGTTFWFSPEKPAFLIERAFVSGTGFSGSLTEVTNDQNVRGIPTRLDVNFDVTDVSNSVQATLDMRRATTSPLLAVDYTGSGFTANIDGTAIAAKSGVPSINGKTRITLSGSGGPGQFSAGGSVDLYPVSITSDGFENALITKYYQQALGAVDRLNMAVELGYNESRGVWLDLDGNFAEQFMAALLAVVKSIGNDAKNFALQKIQEQINNSQNEVLAQVKSFLGIEGDIDLQNLRITDLQQILENKKAEVEAQLKKIAADEAKKQVENIFGSEDTVANDAAAKLLEKWGF